MVDSYRNERLKFLEEIIASGTRAGFFRTVHPHLFAQILLSAIQELQQISVEGRSEIPFDEALEELYDLMLHGLVLK